MTDNPSLLNLTRQNGRRTCVDPSPSSTPLRCTRTHTTPCPTVLFPVFSGTYGVTPVRHQLESTGPRELLRKEVRSCRPPSQSRGDGWPTSTSSMKVARLRVESLGNTPAFFHCLTFGGDIVHHTPVMGHARSWRRKGTLIQLKMWLEWPPLSFRLRNFRGTYSKMLGSQAPTKFRCDSLSTQSVVKDWKSSHCS